MSRTVRRVAMVFDGRSRPETTGGYCRRALAAMTNVRHFLPDELSSIEPNDFDLLIRIDDGLDYAIQKSSIPAVWWVIDSHLRFDFYESQAADYDHLFCAQRDGAEEFWRRGYRAEWLPLAADPAVHRRHETPVEHDLCFVGSLIGGVRTGLLAHLRRRWPAIHIGQEYFDDLARRYSASRVVFNRSIRNDLNMRVFEAMACGSLLATNDLAENGQAELFQDGVHLAAYVAAEDCVDKIAWYLNHEDIRARVAAAGHAEVHAKHTYRHRMERLLQSWEAQPTTLPAVGISAANDAKDPTYFEFARPELLKLVPPTAERILDVGCGAGALGAALKRERGAFVVGLERETQPAELAAARLDRVLVGDVESMEFADDLGTFDAVVCGDVLEHLRKPLAVLRKLRGLLTDDGRLIASIPNVRNLTVVGPLLRGHWTYEPAGLLDDDHCRFFTRREIAKLFFRAGFDVESLTYVPGPGYDEWRSSGRLDEVRLGPITLAGLPHAEAEEFYAYQYLVVGKPRSCKEPGLTSIVIATHNQLHLTRDCLASIRHRTDEPYELIVVDNGSTDGTLDYLRSCGDVRLVANAENRGFPAAANQGMRAAAGDYVLLLNNDTLATTGWLTRMLDAFNRDPTLGLVGPSSNCVGGEQQIDIGYECFEELDGFAWDLAGAQRGVVEPTNRLVGFCLLARKRVVDEVGLLDERFGIGNFEDDDWCRRAILAGWKCGIVRDSFVHHYGHATFRAKGDDLQGLLERNAALYREKWAEPSTNGLPPEPPPVAFASFATRRGLRLVRRVRLSATLIVRNNENTIRACLESLRPWVDEIVVVDTGSTDRTPELCRELGCRVYFRTWPDSFGEARNYALDYAMGEWIFWMDSDDVLPPECGKRLRELLDEPRDPSISGFVMQVHCPHRQPDGTVQWSDVHHVKMFRNLPTTRWEFRIHEQILGPLRRAGGEVAWTDLYVVHAGSDQTPEGRRRKLARDYRLLELELRDRPEHPFALFNLGMTYTDDHRYEEACEVFARARKAGDPGDSHVRKLYALWVTSLFNSNKPSEAWERCQEAVALFPEDLELASQEAELLEAAGQLEQAVAAYRRLLALKPKPYFASVSPDIQNGAAARVGLARVLRRLGRFDEAARLDDGSSGGGGIGP